MLKSFVIVAGLFAPGALAQFSSAANAFNQAVAGTSNSNVGMATSTPDTPSGASMGMDTGDASAGLTVEEQMLLDSFFDDDSPASDYTNLFGSGMMGQTYGLAHEIVNGDLGRLSMPGLASPGYSSRPMSSYGAVSLSCGLGYVEEPFRTRYLAVSPSMYNDGFSCGRCVKLQCDDLSCKEPGKQLVATIVDQGGELFDGDVTISGSLFNELTGRDISVNPTIAVSWNFVSCEDFIDSALKMLVKPGGSAYYQALSFSNSRQPILAVMVNGDRLRHESNHYWSWNPSKPINPRGGFDVAILGANKQVLRARLPTLRSSDLGIQFARSTTEDWDAMKESRSSDDK